MKDEGASTTAAAATAATDAATVSMQLLSRALQPTSALAPAILENVVSSSIPGVGFVPVSNQSNVQDGLAETTLLVRSVSGHYVSIRNTVEPSDSNSFRLYCTRVDSCKDALSHPMIQLPLDCMLLVTECLEPIYTSSLTQLSKEFYLAVCNPLIWRSIAHFMHYKPPSVKSHPFLWRRFVIERRKYEIQAQSAWYNITARSNSCVTMRPPALDEDIYNEERSLQIIENEFLNRQIQLRFHESLRALLRCVNGQKDLVAPGHGLVFGARLLSVAEMIEYKSKFFKEQTTIEWLPITDWSGHVIYSVNINRLNDNFGRVYKLSGRTYDPFYLAPDVITFLETLI